MRLAGLAAGAAGLSGLGEALVVAGEFGERLAGEAVAHPALLKPDAGGWP